eukprot:CAMPEP_0197027210 /NCGR_PEP_ID=MMETSP1384-20130603/7163_1 /TAXON_ID=29189 /ORGANISM="Ammonia sp." /LENGTH=364 /DNA_ID=CAMNT_0042456021 /DNA_START=26 /DNA_END=1120 /DNA_ORIENTATION=-
MSVAVALYVIGAVLVIVLLAVGFNVFRRFEAAEPNEWLLLIKDGELKSCGIGTQVFRGFNETVVKFPSLLNKVSFSAQQVSKEMQGVELSGFIIWVINRDGQCPLKAYRHIRNLSNLTADSEVNMHIKSMAESIVRSQIANLEINQVITQRKKVRDGIVGEMQEIVSGWGIWLETVEITEVKILSGSLFNDLQQPFRSSSREMAENIKIESQFKIDNLRTEKDIETRLMRQKQEQQLHRQREEIKRSNIEMENKTKLLECKMEMQIQKERQAIGQDDKEHALKLKELDNQHQLKQVENEYALDAKMSAVSMRKQVLQTVENIYRAMNVREMKIVNLGSNQGLEYGVAKMAAAFREIGSQLEDDE